MDQIHIKCKQKKDKYDDDNMYIFLSPVLFNKSMHQCLYLLFIFQAARCVHDGRDTDVLYG